MRYTFMTRKPDKTQKLHAQLDSSANSALQKRVGEDCKLHTIQLSFIAVVRLVRSFPKTVSIHIVTKFHESLLASEILF